MKCVVIPALLAVLAAASPPRAGVETEEPRPMEDRFFTLVLSEEERGRYEFLADDQKERFRAEHWARLDPTPTTKINEREMEHQHRVIEALRTFRDESGFFIWDDRTRAFIRFGKPLVRTPFRDDLVPREIWSYPDMVLWFEDPYLETSFQQGFVRRARQSWDAGEELDIRYLDTEVPGRPPDLAQNDSKLAVERAFQEISLEANQGWEMARTGHRRWLETPELNEIDNSGTEEIPFVFDVSSLAGSGGKTDLLIGILVPNDELDFANVGDQWSARVHKRVALRDTAYVIRAEREALLDHRVTAERKESAWLLTLDSLAVDPGSYELILRVEDRISGGRGLLVTPLDVPDYEGPDIRVSDLVFAAEVSKSFRAKSLYERRGHRIIPRPARTYPRGEEIFVFFEVYNVSRGRGERYYFDVTYRLEGRKKRSFISFFGGTDDGRFEEGSSQTFSSVGREPVSARFLSLVTADMPADTYKLTIEALDIGTGKIVRSEATFEIVEPREPRREAR